MTEKQKATAYQERKRTIRSLLILLAVVMIAIMGVRFALNYIDFKELINFRNTKVPEEKFPNLYNASRFFFRIYYPDGWMVEGENYGFIQDSDSGLVAEMYPTIETEITAADGIVSKTQERDPILTARFYYREFTDEQRADVSDILSMVTPNPSSKITGENDLLSSHLNPKVVNRIAEDVFEEYELKYGAFNDFKISALKDYATDDILFKYFTVSYTVTQLSPERMQVEDVIHSVDVYVAARSINYVIIVYDGTYHGEESPRNGYTLYRKPFLEILEEFRFSVFED